MQQSNLGNCLATSVDIGAVRGSYLNNQRELTNKLDCNGNFTHQGLTSNWNHVQSLSGERVMDSTSRMIMCFLRLNLSEFKTSQSYQWRPDYDEALKHSRRNYKREADKRFKPPDLDQDKHQDRLRALVWCVISNLLPRSIKEPFRSLLCHLSIHMP
ncbi:hypothetical protein DY000_02040113 [Brassica cretica]|uniref:Uncharacterized protein n=1 Tax=Brassica cretica TaxID=69181 RepID=A0ABQ7B540_BRACR|nr:hypothetical protein DY000_02040113 [Brassica cretica]